MLYAGCLVGVEAGALLAGASGLDPTATAVATIILLVPALAGRACSSSPSTPRSTVPTLHGSGAGLRAVLRSSAGSGRPARVGTSVPRDGAAIPRILGLGRGHMAVGPCQHGSAAISPAVCRASHRWAHRVRILSERRRVRAGDVPAQCIESRLGCGCGRRGASASLVEFQVPCSPVVVSIYGARRRSSNSIESATAPAPHRGSMSLSPGRSRRRARWS